MILHDLAHANIRNVLVFVADSLRYDHIPASMASRGICVKTVAASLWTASAFPSIVSGLYPPRHGVYSFHDELSADIPTLLRLPEYHTSLWVETMWTDSPPDDSQIHAILGDPAGRALTDIEEPFVYVEDDKGGHCPYGISSYPGSGCTGFFRELGRRGIHELRASYQKGVEESIERFHARLEILSERGLLDRTLVVFTSDHGELLGEYGGLTAHGKPPCPELVYVPTVFMHPSIEQGEIGCGIMRHIDLFPTICAILGLEIPPKLDGIDLSVVGRLPEVGLNFRRGRRPETRTAIDRILPVHASLYGGDSVWDSDGGWAFHRLDTWRGMFHLLCRVALGRHQCHFLLEDTKRDRWTQRLTRLTRAFRQLTRRRMKYGEPRFSESQARTWLDIYLATVDAQDDGHGNRQLSSETKERLKQLGYVD